MNIKKNKNSLFRAPLFQSAQVVVYILFLFLAPLFSIQPVPSQLEIPVEVDVQVPILLNVLTFDRNLKQRVGSEIVFGIIYQEKNRPSLDTRLQVEQYLKKSKTQSLVDIPLRVLAINYNSLSQLKSDIEREKINIIYLTPLRAVNVVDIAILSNSLKITSLTGVPEFCEAGITVGIGSKGGNPLIVINLDAADAAGCDFSSRLLKLAKVINHSDAGK